jgi:hypothetical protein
MIAAEGAIYIMTSLPRTFPSGDTGPCAILHPNGGVFIFPTYDQRFVQRFKRLIPPHTRVFHEVQHAYVVIAPYHRKALALAAEWWPDLVRHATPLPYDFLATDAQLVLQRRKRVAA